jgi:hypothetical protein
MRQEAQILLDIIQRANKKQISLPPGFLPLLGQVMDITNAERDEIGEILAADIRESVASSPMYGHVNDVIKWIIQPVKPV